MELCVTKPICQNCHTFIKVPQVSNIILLLPVLITCGCHVMAVTKAALSLIQNTWRDTYRSWARNFSFMHSSYVLICSQVFIDNASWYVEHLAVFVLLSTQQIVVASVILYLFNSPWISVGSLGCKCINVIYNVPLDAWCIFNKRVRYTVKGSAKRMLEKFPKYITICSFKGNEYLYV